MDHGPSIMRPFHGALTSAAEQPLLSLARFGFFALTLTIEIHSSVRVSRRGGGRHFASVQSS